ncbi:MAG: PD-(D/E)XK nuclease family protein, partial [Actinomycetota bacterium]|nr:PD-(D/E)XK nuclease family protein [Actinomycetota bacterium]
MPLSLVVGPANGGNVALLLDRYLQALDREPVLVVPNRVDVERAERELLTRSPALLGASIGTFDDLFDGIARRAATPRAATARRAITRAQRAILLKRLVAQARLNGFSSSARFPGFVATLEEAIAEVESALLEPDDLDDGPLAALYEAYRSELDRLGLTDRELERRRAAALVGQDLRAWDGRPVFAHGFEDLTGAQWALVTTLAGRAEVTVSLSYEAGRTAFRSLAGTAADLARLAGDRIDEVPAGPPPEAAALAHLERRLFEDSPTRSGASPSTASDEAPALAGAVRFLEAAGSRSALELAAEEILSLLRSGVAAEEIAVVSPAVDRLRPLLETSFGALGVPYAIEGTIPLGSTPFGRALVALLRFAWLAGTRGQLFTFLRSRYSGLARQRADFLEGRLRGRAVSEHGRVEEEAIRLLGHPIPALAELRAPGRPLDAVRSLADSMLRAAHGLESPPVGEDARLDLRAHQVARTVADELDDWATRAGGVDLDEVVTSLERAPVRVARSREPGRVAVLDVLRARTGSFAAVFVLGLEEGVFPRRAPETPFLREEERRELEAAAKGQRIARPDPLEWDRFLFYSACGRARRRLVLVRQAATDDGRPLEPSPFYEEVRSHFAAEDVERWTRRRSLSELSWELERAPSERERLRATASLAAVDEAEARALAGANGWARRLDRALSAFSRPTRLSNPRVLRQLAETTRFSVTELERFGTCSSMWFLERVVDPKAVDAEVDARMRGAVAHQALFRFYAGLPRRLGSERVERDRLEEALAFLRECLAE